mmetsp:Transcript_43919/g.110709  ORF Transcript_43919/g.110709 Transcript_43919/m.110709 type:complete len:226 (+) Transcript_43919:204-881(+)
MAHSCAVVRRGKSSVPPACTRPTEWMIPSDAQCVVGMPVVHASTLRESASDPRRARGSKQTGTARRGPTFHPWWMVREFHTSSAPAGTFSRTPCWTKSCTLGRLSWSSLQKCSCVSSNRVIRASKASVWLPGHTTVVLESCVLGQRYTMPCTQNQSPLGLTCTHWSACGHKTSSRSSSTLLGGMLWKNTLSTPLTRSAESNKCSKTRRTPAWVRQYHAHLPCGKP